MMITFVCAHMWFRCKNCMKMRPFWWIIYIPDEQEIVTSLKSQTMSNSVGELWFYERFGLMIGGGLVGSMGWSLMKVCQPWRTILLVNLIKTNSSNIVTIEYIKDEGTSSKQVNCFIGTLQPFGLHNCICI